MIQALKDSKIINNATPSAFFEGVLSDISVGTQSTQHSMENYGNISNTIVNQIMSVSGVYEDEESMDLLKFRNAYNLSAQMISVMTEIYDRLILETGV